MSGDPLKARGTADVKYLAGLVSLISAVIFYVSFPGFVNGGITILLVVTCVMAMLLAWCDVSKPAYRRPRWRSRQSGSPRMSRVSLMMCAALWALAAVIFTLRFFKQRNMIIESTAGGVAFACWLFRLRDKSTERRNASSAKIAVRLQ